ncbi:MAG: BadF/BadG/BcrA/BcrD ATPase family protein, partial [Betaproteobacteria bacterium]
MRTELFLGIDIGSVTIKTAVLDADRRLLAEAYVRIMGDPLNALLTQLKALSLQFPENSIKTAGITGSGGKQVAGSLGALFINEILAQSAFAGRFHPDARTIIELGGEDAKLITLVRDKASGSVKIEDFSMNTACAAGTGSFLDQQANRLHLTIEEFSNIALQSKTPPRVAGRCSVFAKSDMIHL